MWNFEGWTFVENKVEVHALANTVTSVWRDRFDRQILIKNYFVARHNDIIIHDHNSKPYPDDAVVYDKVVLTDKIKALPREEQDVFFAFFDKTSLMLPELRRFFFGENLAQKENVSSKAAKCKEETVEWEGEKFLSFKTGAQVGSRYVDEALRSKTPTPELAITKAVICAASEIDFEKPDGEPLDEDEVMNAVVESGLVSKLVDWEDWPHWAKKTAEERFGRHTGRNPYLIIDTADFINDMIYDGKIMLVSYCRHGQTKLALIEYDHISGLFDEYFC